MLTTLLSTVVLGMLLQDADAAAAEPVNDAKAQALLEEFEGHLYSPIDRGLESLAFDITVPNPMGQGNMGVVKVTWQLEGRSHVAFEMDDAMLEAFPEAQREQMRAAMLRQLETQMQDMGDQLAAIQTNRMMTALMKKMNVKLEGTQDGFLKIVAKPKPGVDGIRLEQVLLLDDEGMLQQTQEKVQGPMGVIEQDQDMTWETVEGTDKLVLSSIKAKTARGSQETKFVREKVGDFLLVTRMEQSGPMGIVIEIGNFVVNGEAR